MAEAQLFDRIQWHEGMLLTPQHFQQESARVDALIGWQALAGQPAAWGLRRLVVDEARFARGVLRIGALEAVLPNGMAVRYDADHAQGLTLELDLAPYADAMAQQDLPVYLVVGTTRSLRLPGQPPMFRRIAGCAVEDEVSEAQAEEVPRMSANLSLLAGQLPGAAYVYLQLMTLRKENEVVRRGAWWPAQLEVSAASPISQRARALAALMRTKAVFLAQQSKSNSSRLEDRLAVLELRFRLSNLMLNLPLLEATLDAPAVQPLALYLALCAQLGSLAALGPGVAPPPPPYVHGDSYAAFDTVLTQLHALASEVSQQWRSCAFTFDGESFALPMRPEWLGAQLVVGLRGQGERESAQWMAGATIGSRTVSASLLDWRVRGAARAMVDDAPELGLRGGAGCTLFAITVDDQFIVAGQDLLIGNGSASQAALRPKEIVLFIKG
ncbi:type VI secretion system baseplate subunit TssK [Massilia sp. CMS3.1]|uniref:type VI secretion system baseplate subunit TssK n=1 Tax=Massilia sp. CMS3.1 TaxID=3373083 RepID=UPI003EE61736